MKYVILGNGIAGVCAAEAIRRLDGESSITMIGDERVVPYSRPMISMVLQGSASFDRLPIRNRDFYDEWGITALLGKRVLKVDVRERAVHLPGGEQVDFDRLLIATGADARRPDVEGSRLEGIHCMRNREDVRRIVEGLSGAARALVLGGGLVGFKAAYGLMSRGIDVTMLISSAYPLSMQVDETGGRMILEELLDHGLDVRVGISVEGFDGEQRVRSARLSDGSRMDCDLVVVAKGVVPAHGFVASGEVAKNRGILVNRFLETSAPGVYAAGDVVETVDIVRGTRWINAIWPEAAAQGRIAGQNMADRRVSYRGSLGRNVMRVFGLDVMTLGLVNPGADSGCRVLQRNDGRRGYYRKLVLKDDVLVGAMMINGIEQGGVLLALIRNRVRLSLPARRLLSPSFNVACLMP